MASPYKTPKSGQSQPRESGHPADRFPRVFWYGVLVVVLALAMMVASHAIYVQLGEDGGVSRIVFAAMDVIAAVSLIVGSILIVFFN